MSPYRTAAVKPPAITEKIMTHSTWGGGRFRMRWDHNSGFIEFGITENAMTEPEFWLRVDVEDAGRVYHALSQAIGMATPAPRKEEDT